MKLCVTICVDNNLYLPLLIYICERKHFVPRFKTCSEYGIAFVKLAGHNREDFLDAVF